MTYRWRDTANSPMFYWVYLDDRKAWCSALTPAWSSSTRPTSDPQLMRVIFAGTPEFARVALERLHAAGFTIPLVLTQPDRPAGRGMKLQASPVKQLRPGAWPGRGAAAQPAAGRQVPRRRRGRASSPSRKRAPT